jgi:hypothetical protein
MCCTAIASLRHCVAQYWIFNAIEGVQERHGRSVLSQRCGTLVAVPDVQAGPLQHYTAVLCYSKSYHSHGKDVSS